MGKRLIFTVTNDLTFDQRMHRICTTLSEAGHRVLLIGRELKHSAPLQPAAFDKHRLKCRFNKGKLFYLEYNLRLLIYLLRAECYLLCAIDLDTIFPVFTAGKLRGRKIVFDAHEWFSETPEVERRPVVQWIWRSVARLFIPRFDAAYTVSESLALQFTADYGIRFNCIRNVPVLKPVNNCVRERIILYQGALNEGRGLPELIQAMHQIDARLVLAGEGDLSGQLRSLVRQNNLAHKIEFAGNVMPEHLHTLTCSASIGINLLEARSKSYYYSLANKFFDYVHAGIPQLCMKFPEYEKLNSEFEVAVTTDAIQPEIIAATLSRVLNDETFYSHLQHNCTLARQRWNWQTESEKLLTIYESVCR